MKTETLRDVILQQMNGNQATSLTDEEIERTVDLDLQSTAKKLRNENVLVPIQLYHLNP